MAPPLITLLSDFGDDGPYVAAVRGVLLALAPDARLVDISHNVPPHDILAGAYLLAAACPHFPPGAVHLAVVDPGVGGPRRAIVGVGPGRLFVGPDNGLFTLAFDRELIHEFRRIEPARLGLTEASPTFHGRDLFAPAAARLAQGLPVDQVGPPVTDPVRTPLLRPRRAGRTLRVGVLHVDRFGNVTLNLTRAELDQMLRESGAGGVDLPGARGATPFVRTYEEGPADAPFLLWGSSGWLEAARRRASAAQDLGARPGMELALTLR